MSLIYGLVLYILFLIFVFYYSYAFHYLNYREPLPFVIRRRKAWLLRRKALIEYRLYELQNTICDNEKKNAKNRKKCSKYSSEIVIIINELDDIENYMSVEKE